MERQRRDGFFLCRKLGTRSVTTDSADGNDVTLGGLCCRRGEGIKKKKSAVK